MTEKPTNNALSPLTVLLPAWYTSNKRALPWRENTDPYRIWISEIMLQQTRVEAVKSYFKRFISALPSIHSLAETPEDHLLKLWEGLGYYSRARNLQKAARLVCERYGGALPADHAALLTLPGIGAYTAGAVASIAFGIPVPAVDGNVLRVFSRFTANECDIASPAFKKLVAAELAAVIPTDDPGGFNQAIMELGATVCSPNGTPHCLDCPLQTCCVGLRLGIADRLPNKTALRTRRIEQKTILLLHADHLLAVRRRPSRGLLAGMWELPWLPNHLTEPAAIAAVRELGLAPLRIQPSGAARHIFTHIEWEMIGFSVSVETPAPTDGLVWADRAQLTQGYPLPTAFSRYLYDWREPLPSCSAE